MQSKRHGGPTAAPYKTILRMAALGVALTLSGTVAAQSIQFSTEADAISGTVTKTTAGLISSNVTIAPVDQSTTSVSGSNAVQAASASFSAFGVEIYNFANINDRTSASDSAALDSGGSTASTGTGSLLGGLVTWDSNSDAQDCAPDTTVLNKIDCVATEATRGLKVNGVVIPTGNYPAGSSFPVQGILRDPECLLGVETFTGSLMAQESQITGLHTPTVILKLTGYHLVGDAVCRTAALLPLFDIHVDIAVGGPRDLLDVETHVDLLIEELVLLMIQPGIIYANQ